MERPYLATHLAVVLGLLGPLADEGDASAAALHSLLSAADPDPRTLVEAREVAWEQLHTGRWSAVSDVFREAYGVAQCLRAAQMLQSGDRCDPAQALEDIDLALIMGGPQTHRVAHRLVEEANDARRRGGPAPASRSRKRRRPSGGNEGRRPQLSPPDPRGLPWRPIKRVHLPSLASFQAHCLDAQQPAIITGAMDHWPATAAWSTPYLRGLLGPRTVPVEVGATYIDDDWSTELMTFDAFADRFLDDDSHADDDDDDGDDARTSRAAETSRGGARAAQPVITRPIGYLAQHELFRQAPELRRDLRVPDYCALLRPDEDGADAEVRGVSCWTPCRKGHKSCAVVSPCAPRT